MPRATTNVTDTERIELKSCPDGFVVLRRLTYGQLLKRRAMSASLKLDMRGKKDVQGEMALSTQAVTEFEFANCIVDHNLEDEDGKPLNFANVVDIARLDPRIGEEIDVHIARMNNFEDEAEDF